MAAATSPATDEGLACPGLHDLGLARSSFYDARRQEVQPPERPAGRPGPKPALTDAELLAETPRPLFSLGHAPRRNQPKGGVNRLDAAQACGLDGQRWRVAHNPTGPTNTTEAVN